jgi:hypothetical protein
MRRLEDHGLPVDMGFEGAAGRAGDDDRWIFFTERLRLLCVRAEVHPFKRDVCFKF